MSRDSDYDYGGIADRIGGVCDSRSGGGDGSEVFTDGGIVSAHCALANTGPPGSRETKRQEREELILNRGWILRYHI